MNSRSVIVHFPDGSRQFQYPVDALEVGDTIWHDSQRYRVIHCSTDEGGNALVTVELDSEDIGDLLGSERGGIELVPVD